MEFETLLTYDYLARPSKLVPLAAEALPEITDAGKTYTVRIRKGIYFIDDPVFKGRKRELTSADYAYSIKRLIDPKLRSPWAWLVEGKILGLDDLAEAAKKTGKFDYDAKVEGIETPDRYTLRIRLKDTDYNLSYILAHEPTSAVAREVIDAYRDESGRAMRMIEQPHMAAELGDELLRELQREIVGLAPREIEEDLVDLPIGGVFHAGDEIGFVLALRDHRRFAVGGFLRQGEDRSAALAALGQRIGMH